MLNVPTPHINANSGDFAETVLMPGDPLRAKFIAENFLTNVQNISNTRNMLGFTGEYKQKRVSVMGSGMGIPSIGIYSYELFCYYNVKNIIRIGSAGSLSDDINLKDIVFAMGACTDSNFSYQYGLNGTFAPTASYNLLENSVKTAQKFEFENRIHIGNILSSDVFYSDEKNLTKWADMGVLAVEMEAAALYMNAAKLHKNALCMVTISDCPLKNLSLDSVERERGFSNMIQIALETSVNLEN